MQHVVSTALTVVGTFLDANGDPITGKVDADFTTQAAYLTSDPTTTYALTIAAITGQSGDYGATFTPTGTGKVRVKFGFTHTDGDFYGWYEDVEVVTAAQADPLAQTPGSYSAGTVGALAANLDAAVTTRAAPADVVSAVADIAAGTVSLVSPVASNGDVTLYQGDDYDSDDSRALDWSTTDAGTWPTLTSATIAFVARAKLKGSETLTASGSVVTGTGATKQVRVELTDAQTDALDSGDYTYQVIATLSSGNVVTLAAGAMTVTRRLP